MESDDNSSHKKLFDSSEIKTHIQNQFIRKLSNLPLMFNM